MAKIKGICRNEDCIKLNEIQEVEKTEFICPECGEPLTPFGGDGGGGFWKKHGKKVTLTAIVLGILAGIGAGFFFMSTGTVPPPPPPSTPSVFVNKTDKDITISYKIDGINYSANIPSNEQYEIELIEDNEAQIYTSIEPADNVFLVNGNESYISTTLQDENVYTITLKPSLTGDDVKEEGKGEYYTYEGSTQNGKPHGNGTMTFVKKCVVPGSKGNIVAQPGEYAIGKWVNGEVNLVTLYQKSGNRTIITHK